MIVDNDTDLELSDTCVRNSLLSWVEHAHSLRWGLPFSTYPTASNLSKCWLWPSNTYKVYCGAHKTVR